MSIREVIGNINQMEADSTIDRYAIGGAVAATFYLEPVATLDIDVFVALRPEVGHLIATPSRIFDYNIARDCSMKGEYVMITDCPVQFLPPRRPLVEEALREATEAVVEVMPARVFTAEHLAAVPADWPSEGQSAPAAVRGRGCARRHALSGNRAQAQSRWCVGQI